MIIISTTTSRAIAVYCCAGFGFGVMSATANAAAPPIRTSSANQVPACVTPERLDAFLGDQIRARGYTLSPRFRKIGQWYQRHGERHRVRWDYAFFQMALETNFLSFRQGSGKRGDVRPSQNNFAGLGTTGGGVPGDRYPNVSTGVLAQIQHLVVYSGERLRNPVGHRTRLKQNVILSSIGKIARRRPVTFADLAGRWAADRRYGRSIQRLAKLFYTGYCNNRTRRRVSRQAATRPQPQRTRSKVVVTREPKPAPFQPSAARQSPKKPEQKRRRKTVVPSPTIKKRATVARRPTPLRQVSKLQLERPATTAVQKCSVQIASFGGSRIILIESMDANAIKLTALNVQPGFEVAMAENFIQTYAPDGKAIGAYNSRKNALSAAHRICRQRTAKKNG